MQGSTCAGTRPYSSKTGLHCTRVSVESIKNRINHNSRETGGVTPHLEIVYRPAVPGIKWCRCHSIRSEETPPDPLSLLLWRGKILQAKTEEHTSENQSRGQLVCRLLHLKTKKN